MRKTLLLLQQHLNIQKNQKEWLKAPFVLANSEIKKRVAIANLKKSLLIKMKIRLQIKCFAEKDSLRTQEKKRTQQKKQTEKKRNKEN